jgi:hypothetical protein
MIVSCFYFIWQMYLSLQTTLKVVYFPMFTYVAFFKNLAQWCLCKAFPNCLDRLFQPSFVFFLHILIDAYQLYKGVHCAASMHIYKVFGSNPFSLMLSYPPPHFLKQFSTGFTVWSYSYPHYQLLSPSPFPLVLNRNGSFVL